MTGRPLVLDVSRLIWRAWAGRLPTGIDRVCSAYLSQYRPLSHAMIQWGRWRKILSARHSDALFAMLVQGGQRLRRGLPALLVRACLDPQPAVRNKIYLNVGHTGLDAPGFANWLHLQGLRPIFMVHDLIPITHPHFCRPGEAARHMVRMRNLLACAEGVIANSADTLNQLHLFAAGQNLPAPEHSLVAWLGIAHGLPGWPAGTMRPQPQGPGFFLAIGTLEARKNHLLLLRLWQRLIDDLGDAAPYLILVGQRGWEADEVFALLDGDARLRRRVTELGQCSDAALTGLLDHARALLMPSFAEGYGLPVVEALHRRCPVIASDLPVFQEIGSAIPLMLSPDHLDDWHRAVLAYRQDCTDRQRQKQALSDYRAPNWADHFDQVNRWMVALARQPSRASKSGADNAISPGR